MNNFLEFINKDIDGKRVFIDTLPTKTKTNKRKFNETLEEYALKYHEYEAYCICSDSHAVCTVSECM